MTGLDDYELQNQIGAGASGTVWRAVRRGPVAHTVAVKRLRGTTTNDVEVSQLRREALVLSELDHPHIVRILDVVEDGDDVAICMQFAPGGSLEALLAARGRLTAGEVVAVAVPIAEALGSAHRRGILHVDVKPANILFTSDGEPLLGDFGVARTLGRLTGILGTGSPLAGTAHYLAPELLDGATPDPRSDVYSLAVVCYEALTGKRPYDAALPLAVLRAADAGAHEPLTSRPDIPTPVAQVVEQAMSRDPERRIATADLLSRALRDTLPPGEIRLPGPATTTAPTTPTTPAATTPAPGPTGTTTPATPAPGPTGPGPAGTATPATEPGQGPGTTTDTEQPPAIPIVHSEIPDDVPVGMDTVEPDLDQTRPFGPRPPAFVPPPPPRPALPVRMVTALGRGLRTGALVPVRLVGAVAAPPTGRGPLRVAVLVFALAGAGLTVMILGRSDGGTDCPEVEEPIVDVGAQVVRGDPEGDGCDTYGTYQLAADATSTGDMLLTIRVEQRQRTIRLGDQGDRLFLGDWDCDGADSPGLYRWELGEVQYYDTWPARDDQDDYDPADTERVRSRGRASLATNAGDGVVEAERCDRIEVRARVEG